MTLLIMYMCVYLHACKHVYMYMYTTMYMYMYVLISALLECGY